MPEINTEFIVAQVLGILLIISTAVAPQLKKRTHFLVLYTVANILFTANMVLLGTLSAVLLGIIATIRTFAFYIYERKERRAPIWLLVIFIVVPAVSVLLAAENPIDYIVLLGAFLIFGQWQRNLQLARIVSAVSFVSWALYQLYYGIYTGALNDFIQAVSAVVAFIRYYDRKKDDSLFDVE